MADDFDCVVVGGGAAGLSAALVLGRARRRTLILDRDGQSNRAAEHVGGLLGHDGTPPDGLYGLAREQLAPYDSVELRFDEAVDARVDGDGFVVALGDDPGEVRARALILATGMDYEVPDVPGFRDHWGSAVFHCPFCHGWEMRDRTVVVYGEGEVAERQARLLEAWTDDVTVVDPANVSHLRAEDGPVQAVALRDGSEVRCDAVLIHAPLHRRGELPERLGLAHRPGTRRRRRADADERAGRVRRRRRRGRSATGRDRDRERPPGRDRGDARAASGARLAALRLAAAALVLARVASRRRRRRRRPRPGERR